MAATATYSHGTLRVNIPYEAAHPGGGQLIVDILDPEDASVGHVDKYLMLAESAGSWQEEVKLHTPLAMEDLMWHRLRYRFNYSDSRQPPLEGIDSLSQILRTPVVHVLGQQSYLAGGPAAVRVIVTDSANQVTTGSGSVQIELVTPNRKSRILYTGRLNQRGTAEAQFRFPAGLVGSYPLRYVVDTDIGSTEFTQSVRLEEKAQILLTTEKPIYQPGQTIHARALALDRSTHEASANRKLTFEVEDSRGNKVFKKATQTDEFGVASADFALADEVNLGTYHLRALMEPRADRGTGPQCRALRAAEIQSRGRIRRQRQRQTRVPPWRSRHRHRPRELLLRQTVDGGEVTVKASGMDVDLFEAASVSGKTDGEGAWHFDLQLPAYFAGGRCSQGAAQVLVEATVKDSAGHAESRGEPITVSEQPILITAVPEGGTLVPSLDNQVFILTSYPDGQPAATEIKVRGRQSATTDAGGVAVIRMQAGRGTENLTSRRATRPVTKANSTRQLTARGGEDQILLRTERAVYRAGDRIRLHVFSTHERGTAYVDVVKEGQTVLTRDLDIVNGQAELTLTATPDLAGTVDFNAYLFGRDARPVADHRLAFVQPADELKIEATADAAVYKPGDDARIHFRVTNARGAGVRAALGLQVVDEAVFALAEKQPGFAKVFFYLEQEVMKPRYEIHSIGMPEMVTTGDATRDLAGRALFAATEIPSSNNFDREFGRTMPQTRYATYHSRYQERFREQAGKLAQRLTEIYRRNPDTPGLPDALEKLAESGEPLARDAWGLGFRLDHPTWMARDTFQLRSSGPDKRFGDFDDLTTYLRVNTGKAVGRFGPGGTIDLSMEHDRGPFNGLAEIVGTVLDASGAPVGGAIVTARSSTGKTMTAHTDSDGQFHFSGVLPGDYKVESAGAGFRIASRELKLAARDRAVLSATLEVGAATETIIVEEMGSLFATGSGGGIGAGHGGGVGNGIAGGAVGGVLGGIVRGVPSAAPPPAPRQFDGARIRVGGNVQTAKAGVMLNGVLMKTESAAPHVRSWFPESLYVNPEIITDKDGAATIAIPMADSITTWHMAMLASTTHGALGSGTSSLKVFQDFFADLDLPVTLTQGDRVSIPVAVYNYSGSSGRRQAAIAARGLVRAGVRRSREDRRGGMRDAWARRNSRSKPAASANSS